MSSGPASDDADGGRRGLRPEPDRDLLAGLRRHYDLPDPAELSDLGGSAHLNLRWAGGSRSVVVRAYRTHVTPGRLTAIQRARHTLAAGGVPTAQLIETRSGAPWEICGGYLVEVEEFVEFDAIMDDWERLADGMAALGRVHSLLADSAADDFARAPLFANYIGPAEALPATRRGASRIRSWQPGADEIAMADAAERLADLLADAKTPGAPRLPGQLVHGDFWHNNVCFRCGELVLVADLDFLGWRSRVDDLALTLHFALCEVPEDKRTTEGIARVAGLTRRYEAGLETGLTDSERAAMPLAIARQPLWSIGGWVARLDDDDTAREHAAGCGPELRTALAIMADLGRWQAALS